MNRCCGVQVGEQCSLPGSAREAFADEIRGAHALEGWLGAGQGEMKRQPGKREMQGPGIKG